MIPQNCSGMQRTYVNIQDYHVDNFCRISFQFLSPVVDILTVHHYAKVRKKLVKLWWLFLCKTITTMLTSNLYGYVIMQRIKLTCNSAKYAYMQGYSFIFTMLKMLSCMSTWLFYLMNNSFASINKSHVSIWVKKSRMGR